MPKLAWMNETHFDHLLNRALNGDEQAVSDIRREWDLQRERIRHLKETGEDMTVDDYRAWARN